MLEVGNTETTDLRPPDRRPTSMRAVVARERAAGIGGLALTEMPYPHAAENDVIVAVHAAGFTSGELDWPGTWTDRAGRDRSPTIPGHEVSGVVTELGYGATGLTVGQRVFGFADWCRNGTLAEFVAVEARNLAPLSDGIDHTVTAWQGLFIHGRLRAGQTVLIHGAAGCVGSVAVQLARETGARVIGTGRAADRQTVLGLGAHYFVDLHHDGLAGIGEVDMVFDVIGGRILDRSAALVRAGGTLVSVAEPPRVQPDDGRAVFFVVESDRVALAALERRVRGGRLRLLVGTTCRLEQAPAAFDPADRIRGKAVIRVIDDVQPATNGSIPDGGGS
jgi:NADPH:quinone reductase-like Zn-dependent oxidoreductase